MTLRIDKILVPTDFSECARVALEQALRLARQHDAEVHFLHVMLSHDEDPYSLVYQLADRHAIYEQQVEICRDAMREVLEAADTHGLTVEEHRQRAYAVGPAILEIAEKLDIDLIVLGAHGRRGLRRLLLGSVAEEVVRRAVSPVMTVRESGEPLAEFPHRIVVPIDFSEPSRLALLTAKQLAGPTTQIDLVHVVEHPVMPYPYDPVPENGADYAFPEITRRVEEAMANFVSETGGEDVECQIEVLSGRPARRITDFAHDAKADLVVIATEGLTGFDHLLLGSVSEKVVRMAECPVLTIKKRASFEIVEPGEPSQRLSAGT